MPNPQIPQGALNRLRGSITVAGYPGLNITASYLGREMISLNFEDMVTAPIKTSTGIVPSPEPYQTVAVAAHLLKTQALANLWKSQLELNSLIGDFTVRLDAQAMDPYQISNGYVLTVAPIRSDGTDAGWVISLGGIYYINSSLWNM